MTNGADEQKRAKAVTLLLFALSALCALPVLVGGCGAIPNADAILHTNPLYLADPKFVGPNGPLTEEQAERVIERLEAHQKTPTDILERHIEVEQALSGVPLVIGNKVTLLKNGSETYAAMLAAIHGAKDNINILMFTFSDGPVGQMFAEALIERQRHGVQVNLAYDSLGSISTSASFFDRLRQNGIAVLEYRPLDPLETHLHWTSNHRNHRKMLVVDGRVAFTGGINISEVYASGLGSREKKVSPDKWRDTDIQVEGPAVREFQEIFVKEWYYQKGPPMMVRNYFPVLERQDGQIVRVLASVPERFSLIYVTLISAIENSQTNVYITDAYFAPDRQMLHALKAAARRGVDVRLLLPSQADEPLIVSAARSNYDSLLKAGVKIYEWQGEMLHAKTATIDGVWSTVGTSNLDWWSIARDNELNAVVLSHWFGTEMNQMFDNDLEYSRQIERDQWRDRGLVERIRETSAGLVEPIL